MLIDSSLRERITFEMQALSMRHTVPMLLVLLGVMIAPSLASAEDPETLGLGIEQRSAVYGGDVANYCGWPSAVYVEVEFSKYCSGTLVHQDIVITAGHCRPEDGRVTIHFGEEFAGVERSVKATCYSGPLYVEDDKNYVGPDDYGYCKLDQPVTDVPIIPPAYGCDVNELVTGKEVVLVGFGESNNGSSRTKRQVTTTITSINDAAVIGGGGLSTCKGDSGGPVFAQMSDGSWRSFGITSGGDGLGDGLGDKSECGGPGIYALMHIAVPWIEEHSDVDITPCHDVDGTWKPTPACGAIPLDPASTNGANWSNSCSGGPLSDFSGLCGEPFEARGDTDPPSVSIITPADGTVYDIAPADVTVSVNADDGDGYGVNSVRLLVNGEEFEGNSDGAAPYEWPMMAFPKGTYTVTAVAVDFEGNEAVSALVSIDVEQEPLINETDGGTTESGEESGEDGGSDVSGSESGGVGGSDPILGCSCSSERDGPGALGLPVLFALGLRRRKDYAFRARRWQSSDSPWPEGSELRSAAVPVGSTEMRSDVRVTARRIAASSVSVAAADGSSATRSRRPRRPRLCPPAILPRPAPPRRGSRRRLESAGISVRLGTTRGG